MGITLPTLLTPFGFAAAVWAAADGQPVAGAIAAVLLPLNYVLWQRRAKPWHDWQVIVLLLPVIACAVYVTWVDRAPGIGLLGISCVLISYHGRHHPLEETRPRA